MLICKVCLRKSVVPTIRWPAFSNPPSSSVQSNYHHLTLESTYVQNTYVYNGHNNYVIIIIGLLHVPCSQNVYKVKTPSIPS